MISTARRAVRGVRRGLLAAANQARSLEGSGLRYCSDGADWIIGSIGRSLTAHLAAGGFGYPVSANEAALGWRNQLIHFGALWAFVNQVDDVDESNRIAVTVHHGSETMQQEMAVAFQKLRENLPRIDRVIYSCGIMGARLVEWGVPAEKLLHIPIGIDLDIMQNVSSAERQATRQELGVPPDAFCVGSFQKDGAGWGEGMEPKLIKGPDLFVEAVADFARDHKAFVLLTGPARGYMKASLTQAGIPFRHDFVDGLPDVARRYRALDAYLVSSREEGGPSAVMESMACGVPLISTRVGMAIDLIRTGDNGILVEVGDVAAMADGLRRIADNPGLSAHLVAGGLKTAPAVGWPAVSALYRTRFAEPILGEIADARASRVGH